MDKTLAELQSEIIASSKRGYPILIAGALYMHGYTKARAMRL